MFLRLLLLVMLMNTPGCSGKVTEDKWTKNRPKTYPASGTVTYKGEPLSGATVVFHISGTEPHAALGRTDPKGKFVLMTFRDGDGAIAGDHRVTITATVTESPPPGINLDSVSFVPKETSLIPVKYGDVAKSGLTATVIESGPNQYQFDLKE